MRSRVLDSCESFGALLFLGMAAAPIFAGLPFASNVLPLGTLRSAWSGGSMFVDNVGVNTAVLGGLGMVLLEFMAETRAYASGEAAEGESEA